MEVLTFILCITFMFIVTEFLIIIDSLFFNNTIQNTFSNILNRIKGDKDE